jgi:hypothetical protein
MDASSRKAKLDLTTPLLTPEPARSDDKKQASSPVEQASSPRGKPSADAGRFLWVAPQHRTPGSPLSGKLAGGAAGPASWLARWKTSAPAEAEVRAQLIRSLKDWAQAGAPSGESKRAESVVDTAVAQYLPADGRIEPVKVWAAVTKVRQELAAPMVIDLIDESLLHASVGADGQIIIDADLLEELRPLLWKQAEPRATADATALREHDGTVTAPPLARHHMRALLADLLPPLTMALCDPADYPLVEAAYKDYHTDVRLRIKAGEDVSQMGVRRYVLEKLRLGQAAAIREAILASVDAQDQALGQLWRDAFNAAEQHIKALRGSELAVFRLEDFIAARLTARRQPQNASSSSTTTVTSPSADGR